MRIFNNRSLEEIYKKMSKEDIELVEKVLKSENQEEYLISKIKEEFKGKSPEELSKDIGDFLNDEEYYSELVEVIPDTKLLLDKLKTLDDYEKKIELLRYIPKEQLFEYVNDNGQASDEILSILVNKRAYEFKSDFIESQVNAMESINSDLNKTKIILFGGDIDFLPYIEDLYYRNQIVKAKSEFDFSTEELLDEIEIYNGHQKKLSEIEDEKDRAQYISSIKNNEMKQALLETIGEKDNRRIVIDSFEREVDPEIASLDELARTMITEFFEDRLGENYTDEMKEKLQSVFGKTDVTFGDLPSKVNGRANHVLKKITISNSHKNNINRNIGFLIHEYAHLFSIFDYCYTSDKPEHSIEEGMADTFSDLVVNNYLEKHKDLILDGKKVRIDKPYLTYSGYEFENAWARTMLAGLETKGQDIEAIAEYLLGDKNKFAEMIFGKEIAEEKEITKFGITKIITNRSELYHSPTLDFSNIDKDSIYYKRNHILPLYEIQNKIGEKEDIVGIISCGKGYHASYIAKQYFNGKKFYEISNDEFEKFIKLIDSQIVPDDRASAIINISKYKNELIDNLTEEEISQFSFEILERITTIWGKNINAGSNLENVMRIAFEEEIKKINEGQAIDITKQKRDIIMEKYKDSFTSDSENNIYIKDYINDFYFEVSQIEESKEIEQQTTLLDSQTIKNIAKEDGVIEQKEKAKEVVQQLQQTRNTKEIEGRIDD